MVNLTIDGQKVSVPQGTTIMQAAVAAAHAGCAHAVMLG